MLARRRYQHLHTPSHVYQHWPPLPCALGPSFSVKGCTEPPKSPPFLVCTTPIATTMVSHVPRPLNDEITAAMFVPRSKSKGARCERPSPFRSLARKKKDARMHRADLPSPPPSPLPSPRETTILGETSFNSLTPSRSSEMSRIFFFSFFSLSFFLLNRRFDPR